jgi:hypothetical protein
LEEAIASYDDFVEMRAELADVPRETRAIFWARVDREGRKPQAEQMQEKLLASGKTRRQTQKELVEQFQPLDGTETRPWETPDPWEAGRLFRSKEVQEQILADNDEDDDGMYESPAQKAASWRLECARWRSAERKALAAARQMASELRRLQEQTKTQPA